jgi:hypothetical protein
MIRNYSSLGSFTSNTSYGSGNHNECFFCLQYKLDDGSIPVDLKDFEHVTRKCNCVGKIHFKCYSEWLFKNKICPVCREEVIVQTTTLPNSVETDNDQSNQLNRYYPPPAPTSPMRRFSFGTEATNNNSYQDINQEIIEILNNMTPSPTANEAEITAQIQREYNVAHSNISQTYCIELCIFLAFIMAAVLLVLIYY